MTTPGRAKHRYIKHLPDGLQVMIPRFEFSQMVSFTGRTYEETLSRALEVRDDYLNSKGQISLLNSIPHVCPTGKNNPLAGVLLAVTKRAIGQIPSAYFRVTFKNSKGEFRAKIFGIRTHGSYLRAFIAALEFRIEKSNLLINIDDVPLLRPTPEQYVLLLGLVDDVPLPAARSAD